MKEIITRYLELRGQERRERTLAHEQGHYEPMQVDPRPLELAKTVWEAKRVVGKGKGK